MISGWSPPHRAQPAHRAQPSLQCSQLTGVGSSHAVLCDRDHQNAHGMFEVLSCRHGAAPSCRLMFICTCMCQSRSSHDAHVCDQHTMVTPSCLTHFSQGPPSCHVMPCQRVALSDACNAITHLLSHIRYRLPPPQAPDDSHTRYCASQRITQSSRVPMPTQQQASSLRPPHAAHRGACAQPPELNPFTSQSSRRLHTFTWAESSHQDLSHGHQP